MKLRSTTIGFSQSLLGGDAEIGGGFVGAKIGQRLPAGEIVAGDGVAGDRDVTGGFERKRAAQREHGCEQGGGGHETGFGAHEALNLRGRARPD